MSVQRIFENRDKFFAAYRLFHKAFRIHFHDYMDLNLTKLTCKPVLDIYKFDDWLHDKFGNYENEDLSMFDVLKKNYGEEISLKVKELI